MSIELRELLDKRQALKESLESAIKTRNQMEGKMQSRYDTQREEWALQCDILEGQIQELDKLIEQIRALRKTARNLKTPPLTEDAGVADQPIPDPDVVIVGSTVEISVNGSDPEVYILLADSGGHRVSNVTTLSIKSPVGEAILNKRKGDTIVVKIGKEPKSLSITVQVLDLIQLQPDGRGGYVGASEQVETEPA